LTDSRFDYIKNDSEVTYLKAKLKEKKEHEPGVTTQDYIETSDSNLLGHSLTETEMFDRTKKYIWQRNKLRTECLTRFRKDIDLHLIVLTGIPVTLTSFYP